jgi:hypothetical protein
LRKSKERWYLEEEINEKMFASENNFQGMETPSASNILANQYLQRMETETDPL